MDELNLRQLLRPLLKWWWLIAACTLLAAISSGLYTLRQPKTYISTTTIMVGSSLLEPNPNAGDLFLASQLAGAYTDMVQRSTIRAAAQEQLGMTWLPYYTARLVPDTQLIEISVIDTDPARAQAVANELVNQLMLVGPGMQEQSQHQAFIEQQLAEMENGITQTGLEIKRVQGQLAEMFSAKQIRDARDQIAALESKLASLQANYASLLANSNRGAINTIHVLEPASLPGAPMSRDLVVNMIVAATLGMALASAAAYVMFYLDNSLQTEEDVQDHLSLPALGLVPKNHITETGFGGTGSDTERGAALSDAFSSLRLNIQAVMAGVVPKMLLVTSPMIGDGKSSVAANLAVEYVHAGYSVLLVDADLRRPTLHRLLNLRNQGGLTTLLLGEEQDADKLIQPSVLQGLSILTSGPLPPNPTHLLSRKDMHSILMRLAHKVDVVILDSPPLTATVDASILATQVDAVLLVIASARTKRGPTVRAVKSLRHLKANLVGVAINGVPASETVYSSGYGYTMEHSGKTKERRSADTHAHPEHQTAGSNPLLTVNGTAKRSSNPLLQLPRKH